MRLDNNQQAFFALLRAGLWEKDVQLLPYGTVDFSSVYKLAEEQSVVGLIAAGLEHVVDVKIPKEDALLFVGNALQLEQRNAKMNMFIGVVIDRMRSADIYSLLVKGQGIAQCYERPLWRACGDVDFFLSDTEYDKAKEFFTPIASQVEKEGKNEKHQGYIVDQWSVELHGSLRCGLSNKMDRVIDEVQNDVFYGVKVRSWMNGHTQVFLPDANCDVVFVFTHFIKHFYKEGLGLRQICDWCRLLWKYRSIVDQRLLEKRLHSMGLMSEWKAFGTFAVDYLGMPKEAMPFYSSESKWNRKADRICSFVMKVGNMGHNRDMSYFANKPYFIRKCISLKRRLGDYSIHFKIFPISTLLFYPNILFNGLRSAIRGE